MPLEHAAAEGDMELFTRLIEAGADSRAGWWGCKGRTLLGAAIQGGNEGIVVALLEAGAKPDVDIPIDAGGGCESALHWLRLKV